MLIVYVRSDLSIVLRRNEILLNVGRCWLYWKKVDRSTSDQRRSEDVDSCGKKLDRSTSDQRSISIIVVFGVDMCGV